ncbi:MAG: YggT family protein [Patescibacteria group bacterium]
MDSYNSPTTKPIFRSTQVVWYILALLEILLAFRFVLKATAANASAGFANFIYTITWPFTQPFAAVFGKTQVAGSVIEWTTLLAMLVYLIVAWGIIKLFLMSRTVSTPEAAARLDK